MWLRRWNACLAYERPQLQFQGQNTSENKGAVITCKKSKREEQRWCHLHGWLPLLCLSVTEPDVSGVPGVRPILKFFCSFLCDITGEGRTTLKDIAVFKEESSIAPFRMKDVQGWAIPGKTTFTIRTNLLSVEPLQVFCPNSNIPGTAAMASPPKWPVYHYITEQNLTRVNGFLALCVYILLR